METKDILLLGVKRTIIAFQRSTGVELWRREIGEGLLSGSNFVSLQADEQHVFAHTSGELHCLDLQTGTPLWNDKLSGLGYGVATLAFPDGSTNTTAAAQEKLRQDAARRRSASSGQSVH